MYLKPVIHQSITYLIVKKNHVRIVGLQVQINYDSCVHLNCILNVLLVLISCVNIMLLTYLFIWRLYDFLPTMKLNYSYREII